MALDFDIDIDGERKLWQSVVLLLFRDIMRDRAHLRDAFNGQCAPILVRLKNYLLVSESEWMKLVCEFADLDHKKFLEIVREAINGDKPIDLPTRFD